MHISIVIPAYNEKYRISNTLARMIHYIKRNGINAEIIVVDDGSTDDTFSLADTFAKRFDIVKCLRNPKNKGKGFSVRRGVLASKGKYILFSDADNSTPIQELNKLLPYLERGECDIVIGSRFLSDSVIKIKQPWPRQIMGKVFGMLVKAFLFKDFKDTQCGFKCFTQRSAREIFAHQKFERFSFDTEVLYIAKLKGFRVKEVPITWVNSLNSRVNPVTDSIHMFIDIFRLKYYVYKGTYN